MGAAVCGERGGEGGVTKGCERKVSKERWRQMGGVGRRRRRGRDGEAASEGWPGWGPRGSCGVGGVAWGLQRQR